MSNRGQKKFLHDKLSVQTINQTQQIREKSNYLRQDTLRIIYIETITAKRTGGCVGIYCYSSYSTHFGRVDFFQYKDNVVTLLNRSNLDSLKAEIESYLHRNNFSKKQVRTTRTKIELLWNIYSTDAL